MSGNVTSPADESPAVQKGSRRHGEHESSIESGAGLQGRTQPSDELNNDSNDGGSSTLGKIGDKIKDGARAVKADSNTPMTDAAASTH